MAEIFQFPETKIVRAAPEVDEVLKQGSKARQVDEFVFFMTDTLYQNLVMNGIEESEIFTEKDFPFLAETLKSAIYRGFGLEHYIQEMVDAESDEYIEQE